MAKETRDAKQYRIYTLYALVDVVIGKNKQKEEVKRTDRVAIAVFDDMDLLNKFTKENKNKLKGQTYYENGADWVEVEPKAENYSLPFNPKPSKGEEAKETKDNGTD